MSFNDLFFVFIFVVAIHLILHIRFFCIQYSSLSPFLGLFMVDSAMDRMPVRLSTLLATIGSNLVPTLMNATVHLPDQLSFRMIV